MHFWHALAVKFYINDLSNNLVGWTVYLKALPPGDLFYIYSSLSSFSSTLIVRAWDLLNGGICGYFQEKLC